MRGPDKKPRKKREGDPIKHGHARRSGASPEWKTWVGIIKRCTDPSEKCYPRYGGAGVTVCDEWLSSFTTFFAHIGTKPSSKHSIDRIDNNRGYEPGNVRWATATEQNRNRRNVKLIDYEGKKLTTKEYCNAVGLSYHTVKYRRDVLKWGFEESLSGNDARKNKRVIQNCS